MDDDPGQGVRRKKDSSLVRAAEAVRDGKAMAMVSAGNTGAAMASALLRMGRLPSVIRPAIATPIPNLERAWPTVLLDSGANAECTSADAGAVRPDGSGLRRPSATGSTEPRVALLSIGEEKSKGTPLEKETHALLADGAGGPGFDFVGNVEGRDFFEDIADVIVTDGFTGNVALKTHGGVAAVPDRRPHRDPRAVPRSAEAADALYPHLLPLAATLDPDEHRRGHAARRGRRVRDQPRLVLGGWPWSTPSPWPTTWPWPVWSRPWPRSVTPAGRRRSTGPLGPGSPVRPHVSRRHSGRRSPLDVQPQKVGQRSRRRPRPAGLPWPAPRARPAAAISSSRSTSAGSAGPPRLPTPSGRRAPGRPSPGWDGHHPLGQVAAVGQGQDEHPSGPGQQVEVGAGAAHAAVHAPPVADRLGGEDPRDRAAGRHGPRDGGDGVAGHHAPLAGVGIDAGDLQCVGDPAARCPSDERRCCGAWTRGLGVAAARAAWPISCTVAGSPSVALMKRSRARCWLGLSCRCRGQGRDQGRHSWTARRSRSAGA